MLGLHRSHDDGPAAAPRDLAIYVRSARAEAVTTAARQQALRHRKDQRSRGGLLPLPPEADYPLPSELIACIPESPDVLPLSLPTSETADELSERAEERLYDLVDDPQEWTLVARLGAGG